jgi:hypothetical protein
MFREGAIYYMDFYSEASKGTKDEHLDKLLDENERLKAEIAELKAPKKKRPVWDSPPMSVINQKKIDPLASYALVGGGDINYSNVAVKLEANSTEEDNNEDNNNENNQKSLQHKTTPS